MDDPFSLNRFAEREGVFNEYVEAGSYYLGVRAQMPNQYLLAVKNELNGIFCKFFDVTKERRSKVSCCYSLTTTVSDELSLLQRLSHFDSFDTDFFAV